MNEAVNLHQRRRRRDAREFQTRITEVIMRSDDLSLMIVTNSTAVAFSFIYGLPLMTLNAVLWHFQSRSRARELGQAQFQLLCNFLSLHVCVGLPVYVIEMHIYHH